MFARHRQHHAPVKPQMQAHTDEAPVSAEDMHLLCKLIAAVPGEKRKHMAGQHNAADHGADHAQENQPDECRLHDAQGRVAPPRHSLNPSAVQNMVCHKQGEHSHADPLVGCLTHKAIGHQKQHGHRHGRIYGDFYFENWFHVLILCCERAPSSNCPGHQRPHWRRRGNCKCPFR